MRSALVLLIVAMLILSACAPVAAPTAAVPPVPSETPAPSAIPAPTATPTRTPTATPTPLPTLPPEQVGGLEGVPDPRYSNPELFDLSDPDAPIPQFVNAIRKLGIETTPEQILQGIQYEAYREDYICARTLATGSELSDGICLLMATASPSETWQWDVARPGPYWRSMGKYAGLYMGGDETKTPPYPQLAVRHFGEGGILALSGQVRPGPDIEERKPSNSAAVRSFRMARDANMGLFFHYVAEPGKYPNYVTSANVDEWLDGRLAEIAQVTRAHRLRYPIFLVYNEPLHPDASWWNEEREPLRDKYGDRYLEEFVYRAMKIFMDNGFTPGKDFVVVINDDTSALRPAKAERFHQMLVTIREKVFDRLWNDEHYQNKLQAAGLITSISLPLWVGFQMSDSTLDQVEPLSRTYFDMKILLTELDFWTTDLRERTVLMKDYVERAKNLSNVMGILIFNPFVDEPWNPQMPLFDEANRPNIEYYQLLR